jgi:hypothetical protein
VQSPDPVVDLYVPIGHAEQLPPVYPAAQIQSDDVVLPVVAVVLPVGQVVHDAAPADEYDPIAQLSQATKPAAL